MKKPYVLDTSAVLAYLWQEPGTEIVASLLMSDRCILSTANLAELATKLTERGFPADTLTALIDALNVEIAPLSRADAELAGLLRQATRHLGLSLGDRICLAVATHLSATVVTADRPWLQLAETLQLDIRCIRPDQH